jgi:hypothetical protein
LSSFREKHADWRQIRSIHEEIATRMRQKSAKFQGFAAVGRENTAKSNALALFAV